MGIAISLINIIIPDKFPLVKKIFYLVIDVAVVFTALMIYFFAEGIAVIDPDKFPIFISSPYLFFKNLFRGTEEFISSPVKYKKQLNNDGGIRWVPYYGKPGRLCEEDKDCPTFQKCKGNKCTIPLGVR